MTVEEIYESMLALRKKEEIKKEEEQNVKNGALFFAGERSVDMVKAYCNIENIPKRLKGVCISIGLLLYDNENYDGEQEFLKSMKQGNVSVAYETTMNKWNQKEILESFAEELERFRVAKW